MEGFFKAGWFVCALKYTTPNLVFFISPKLMSVDLRNSSNQSRLIYIIPNPFVTCLCYKSNFNVLFFFIHSEIYFYTSFDLCESKFKGMNLKLSTKKIQTRL